MQAEWWIMHKIEVFIQSKYDQCDWNETQSLSYSNLLSNEALFISNCRDFTETQQKFEKKNTMSSTFQTPGNQCKMGRVFFQFCSEPVLIGALETKKGNDRSP